MLHTTILRSLITLSCLSIIMALGSLPVMAQTPAARPDRGIKPNASYSVSDIESINLQNGNLSGRQESSGWNALQLSTRLIHGSMRLRTSIWKGLVGATQRKGVSFLGDAQGGYVNVVASAQDKTEFVQK
jgi:hypothetical protein